MDDKLIILAGGVSSRMRSSTTFSLEEHLRNDADHKPKSLIRVGTDNRPFLDYLLYNIREAGYRDIVIVIGENDSTMKEYYGKKNQGNAFHGLTIGYAVQSIPAGRIKPLGTADAVEQALAIRQDWKGNYFTVCNSDNLYSIKILRELRMLDSAGGLIDYDRDGLDFAEERISQFAVIEKDENGFLTDILEKPTPEQIERLKDRNGRVGVSMNIFRLHYDLILPHLRSLPLHPTRQEKELPTAVRALIKEHPKSMQTIPVKEHVPDLSNKNDIYAVQQFLAEQYPHFSFEN